LSRSETPLPGPAFLGVERSLTGRRWLGRATDQAIVGRLAEIHGLPELLSRLLVGRGFADADLPAFLQPTLKALLPDPSRLADMDRAADRLAEAIVSDEPVALYADYDVDGATSAALLAHFLAALGRTARIYVPDRRQEGYGPNAPALLRLAQDGIRLVLTLDSGTNAHAPLTAARDAGLDVIVVDHHQGPPVPPPATAVINPNRPDDESGLGYLAAVGVAFLLVVATNRALRQRGWYRERPEPDLRRWLDLVALGTVCDMVPLRGINRAFVVQGLKVAAQGGNPGLVALSRVALIRGPLTSHDLGFAIGPRINAGGRVGESDLGARLLATDSEAEAAGLAVRLDRLNRERQQVEQGVLERALLQCRALVDSGAPLLWVIGEDWHPGVIGIVASRLVERFHKPAVVLAVEGGQAVASGRSLAGIDLGQAIQTALAAGMLVKGGGHAMAGGFTVTTDRLDELARLLGDQIDRQRQAADGAATQGLAIEASLTLAGVSRGLAGALDRLAPFGAGNPEPLFGLADARIERAVTVAGRHLQCQLADAAGRRLSAMAFRAVGTPLGKALANLDGAAVHLAGRVRVRRDSTSPAFLAIEDAALPC
jgi:single-stranded-DNA-specific exonuclease